MKKFGAGVTAIATLVLVLGMAPASVLAEADASSVSDQVSATLLDRVSADFHRAREEFLKDDLPAAAAAVDRGAAYIKVEADRATDEGKEALSKATADLTKLAEDLRNGAVSSAEQLNNTFASIHQTLATHHYLKAAEDWAASQSARAGQEMKAASTHLQSAWAWANQHVDNATSASIKEAREIGTTLAAGGSVAAEKVGTGLERLGRGLRTSVTSP